MHHYILSLYVLLTFSSCCFGFRLLDGGPHYECTNRYEFRHLLHERVKQFKNCSYVKQLYPLCKEKITVALSLDPPYTVAVNSTSTTGLLPGMLKVAIDTCCHGCTEIKYQRSKDEIGKFFMDDSEIIMPHEGASMSTSFIGFDYVNFIEVTGVTFLVREKTRNSVPVSKHLFDSVIGTWPLFLTAFVMAFIAGCVVWILDTWFNRDEFPSSFPRGPFEGFWWAFVSMTTVGYGDRAPKSITARVFAIIWILAGITIFSMYTATLTAALSNEIEINKIDTLYGKQVGVLKYTAAGHSAAIQEHAHITVYENVDELIDALKHKKVYAIALDDNIIGYYLSKFQEKVNDIAKHHRVAVEGNSYGILSYDKNLTQFLKSFFAANADNRDAIIAQIKDLEKIPIEKPEKGDGHTTVLFSAKSRMFYVTIGVLLACGMLTVFIGLMCKWFFKRNHNWLELYVSCQEYKKKKPKSNGELAVLTGGKDLQKEFIQELDDLKEKWTKLLQQTSS